MRYFVLATSWVLWILCGLMSLMFILVGALGNVPPPDNPPRDLAGYTRLFWISLVMFTTITVVIFLLRRRFWIVPKRKAGVGFWLLTVLFYISVLCVNSAGFAPFFAGDRSSIQWISCALAVFFLVVGFPSLPVQQKPPSVSSAPR
jgi:hypothetical protein